MDILGEVGKVVFRKVFWMILGGWKNELKKATCLLGDEKPMDTSDRIYELYLILRRRS